MFFTCHSDLEDVNPMSFEELTPLHAAAQLGHEEAPEKNAEPWGFFSGPGKKAAKVAPGTYSLFTVVIETELEVMFLGIPVRNSFLLRLNCWKKNAYQFLFWQCFRGW